MRPGHAGGLTTPKLDERLVRQGSWQVGDGGARLMRVTFLQSGEGEACGDEPHTGSDHEAQNERRTGSQEAQDEQKRERGGFHRRHEAKGGVVAAAALRSEKGRFVSSLPPGVGHLLGQAPEFFGFVV